MSERRYWITNPVGHRLFEGRTYGQDGDIVDTVFGEAVLIVPQPPPANEWYCDMCSEPILTRWGNEPFPVPMIGGYALCLDHYNEAQTWPEEDRYGELIDGTTLGPWPEFICNCQPCVYQADQWIAQWIA